MPESQYERLPQAGDIDRQTGLEILYLAPRPLPTGQAPLSAQQMHREVNGSYLDFAQGTGRIEFGVRATLGTLGLFLFVYLFSTALMAWGGMYYWGKPFLVTWIEQFFQLDMVAGFFLVRWHVRHIVWLCRLPRNPTPTNTL